MTTALVGAAGLAGVLARYGITRLTLHTEALIWSTVGINIVGSFLLGLLAAEHWFSGTSARRSAWDSSAASRRSPPSACRSCWRPTAGVREGRGLLAASVVGGIAAAALGYWLGRRLA